MNQNLKLLLTVFLTLGAVLIITVGWIVKLFLRAGKTSPPLPPGQSVGVDVLSLMNPHHAPFYWLTVLLIVLAGMMAYWRWA